MSGAGRCRSLLTRAMNGSSSNCRTPPEISRATSKTMDRQVEEEHPAHGGNVAGCVSEDCPGIHDRSLELAGLVSDSAEPQPAPRRRDLARDGTGPPPGPVWTVAGEVRGLGSGSYPGGPLPAPSERQENKHGQADPREGSNENQRHRLSRAHDRNGREGARCRNGSLGNK